MADLVGSFIQAEVNRRAQERAFEQQQQLQADAQAYNTLMFNMSNQYNSPIQQMSRFKVAGLNPNLIYGQMANTSSPIGMGSSSSPSPSSIQAPSMLESAQIGLINAQKENIEADTQSKIQDVSESESRIILNESQSDLNRVVASLNDSQRRFYDAQVPLIQQQVSNAFQEGRKLKIDADNYQEYIDAEIRNLTSSSDLSDAQVDEIYSTLQEKINLLVSEALRNGAEIDKIWKESQLLTETIAQSEIATRVLEAEALTDADPQYQRFVKIMTPISEGLGGIGRILTAVALFRGAGVASKVAGGKPTVNSVSKLSKKEAKKAGAKAAKEAQARRDKAWRESYLSNRKKSTTPGFYPYHM